jgi:hypothetical protein
MLGLALLLVRIGGLVTARYSALPWVKGLRPAPNSFIRAGGVSVPKLYPLLRNPAAMPLMER